VLAFSYQDSATKVLVPSDQVEETAPGVYRHAVTHQPLNQVVAKMSKALKNVVNPDEIVKEYGADSLRLYEMFMGPLDVAKPWNSKDIGGVLRFLQRTFRLIMDEETGELRGDVRSSQGSPEIERALHRCIKKVGDDLERFAFNTCISAMMIFLNEASTKGAAPLSISQAERYVKLLAPFAPHVAEELWSKLGHPESLAYASWPTFDAAQLEGESIEMPVQINGKMRGKIVVPNTASNAHMEAAARDFAASFLEGKSIKKVVVVPKRMVNLVVG
jgi:leucyl-tRNA synthetase